MAAAMSNDLEAARRALATECDLERTWQDKTPLQWAVWYGEREVARALLDAGADLDAGTSSGDTVLLLAADSGSAALFRDLLARGARVRKRPRESSMLQRAARNGSAELVGVVLDLGFPIDGRNSPWPSEPPCTALQFACRYGNDEVVRALLERGADAGARTREGWTLLHLAAGADEAKVVKTLTERGADARATDEMGRSVVHFGAELGGRASLDAIRASCAGETWRSLARSTDRLGRTPLHLAAWRADRPAISALLDVSDPAAQTGMGWTAAHLAAIGNDAELARKLSPEQAEPPRDRLGRTPEDLLDLERAEGPIDLDLRRLALDAISASGVLVRWFHRSGMQNQPWDGHELVVWNDGTYLRHPLPLAAGDTSDYRIGVLSAERRAALVDELRETGLLARSSFDSLSPCSSSEDLLVNLAGVEQRFRVTGSVSPDGPELESRSSGLECRRAFGVLARVRASEEDALMAHLVDGAFRGIRFDRQRAPD